MGIEIKQHGKAWIININESFAFEDIGDMKDVLQSLVLMKQQHGQKKQLLARLKDEEHNEHRKELASTIKGLVQAIGE